MDFHNFMFPISERKIAVYNGNSEFIDFENPQTYISGSFKAIVREDSNELISIIRNSYQIVPNEVLINKLMHELVALETPFRINLIITYNRLHIQ